MQALAPYAFGIIVTAILYLAVSCLCHGKRRCSY